MNNIPINDFECNHLKDTICRIDKIQKEIQIDTTGKCIGCETSLFTSANNTIPLSLTTCFGNPVTANIGPTTTTTQFFRVESVRCGRFVTLRLLQLADAVLTGTDYTTIVDLDCIGQIQCYPAINVEVCTITE